MAGRRRIFRSKPKEKLPLETEGLPGFAEDDFYFFGPISIFRCFIFLGLLRQIQD